jgi:hypothetical protein
MHSEDVKPPANPFPPFFDPSTFKNGASICATTSSWYPAYNAGMKAMGMGKYAAAVESFSNVRRI